MSDESTLGTRFLSLGQPRLIILSFQRFYRVLGKDGTEPDLSGRTHLFSFSSLSIKVLQRDFADDKEKGAVPHSQMVLLRLPVRARRDSTISLSLTGVSLPQS